MRKNRSKRRSGCEPCSWNGSPELPRIKPICYWPEAISPGCTGLSATPITPTKSLALLDDIVNQGRVLLEKTPDLQLAHLVLRNSYAMQGQILGQLNRLAEARRAQEFSDEHLWYLRNPVRGGGRRSGYTSRGGTPNHGQPLPRGPAQPHGRGQNQGRGQPQGPEHGPGPGLGQPQAPVQKPAPAQESISLPDQASAQEQAPASTDGEPPGP